MSMPSSFAAACLAAIVLGHFPLGARTQPPEWSVREDLRLGDGPGRLDRLPVISRVIVGADSAVYVLSRTGEVLVFDRSGAPVRRINALVRHQMEAEAREGLESARREALDRRPGAIVPPPNSGWEAVADGAPAMGWNGDKLWIMGRAMGNVALLRVTGDIVRTISYSAEIEGGPADPPLALLADQSLLRAITPAEGRDASRGRLTPAPLPAPPGTYRMPIIPGPPLPRSDPAARGFLMRVTPEGKALQGLEIFIEGRKEIAIRNLYGETAILPFPFRDDPLIAVTPDGSEVVFVERYRPTRAGSASYTVARFDVVTGKRMARHFEYVATPISGTTVNALVSQMIDSADSPLGQRFLDGFPSRGTARTALRAALDAPDFHAPITAVVAGNDHTVWLAERATGRWVVLAPGGDIIGRVALPAGAHLVHANARTAWAVIDHQSRRPGSRLLVRYRLVKP